MDRDLLRICQALILDRWICRGAVENLSTENTSMDREAIEQVETLSMDREFVKNLSRQIPESFDGSQMR